MAGARMAVRAPLAGDCGDAADAGVADGAARGIDALVGRSLADVEQALILRTLAYCRGNRTSAATILGISVRTMRNKLRHFIEEGVNVLPAPAATTQMRRQEG